MQLLGGRVRDIESSIKDCVRILTPSLRVVGLKKSCAESRGTKVTPFHVIDLSLMPRFHLENNLLDRIVNGKIVTSVSKATPKDVDIAVKAVQTALDAVWGLNASGALQSTLMGKLAVLMMKNADELAALEA